MPAHKNLKMMTIRPVEGAKLGKARILVAPLDWGLGHAARCIPIIRELLAKGCEVWLAGEGRQEQLLRAEFPQLSFLHLDGYRLRFSRTSMVLSLILQIPRMLLAISREHKWLKKMVNTHRFDGVISDNRFGLYHERVPCIFITHQLTIRSPFGNWSEQIIRSWNYRFINHFTECWVPDFAEEPNLAGDLSHPRKKPGIPLKYLGVLSRFEGKNAAVNKDHLLFILSGPEPQRTILEDRVVTEISHYPGTATIVRGLPGASSVIPSTGMIKFHNHLDSEQLNQELERAGLVIGRSGYSTIMDIVTLRKKSVLIPTPGQTEQEYLAESLHKKRVACSVHQNDFSLDSVLEQAKKFDYSTMEISGPLSTQIISDFLFSLSLQKSGPPDDLGGLS